MSKIAFLLTLVLSFSAFSADKAKFSVFKNQFGKFAEVTCTGIPGHPTGLTLQLDPVANDLFETHKALTSDWYLVVAANAAPNAPTFSVAFTQINSQPITAATKGLDLSLRLGSGLFVSCDLNDGDQRTPVN